MPSNRDAKSGKFKYPNRSMTPGESKPNVTHLDLRDTTKPATQHFTKPELDQGDGHQRQSPSKSH